MSADAGSDPVSPISPVSAITMSAMDLNQPSPVASSTSQGPNVNNNGSVPQEGSGRTTSTSNMFTGFGNKNSSSTNPLNSGSAAQMGLPNLQGLASLTGLAGFGGALNPQLLMNLDALNTNFVPNSMNEGSTTPQASSNSNTGSNSGGPGNVSQQIILEQFRLAQLQLQHLQAQIFQQQMALISSGAIMGMNHSGDGSNAQSQNQNQARAFHGLPTPGSSTELRASNHPVEFVSPMLLNYADLSDLSNTSSTSSHHNSFASASSHSAPSHVSHGHPHSHSHSHSNPHSLTHTPVFAPHDPGSGGDIPLDGLAPLSSRFSNNNTRSSSNDNENNSIHHRGTSSAPAHIAFSQPRHSNNELDFDISPLTSPWLGADVGSGNRVHGYHHPQHQHHSRQNHSTSSPFLSATGSSGTSNKRTASPSNDMMMEEYSRKTRQSPAVRATIPSSSSGTSPSDIYSANNSSNNSSSSRKNSVARGSRSVNSTPLLKGTISTSSGPRSRKDSLAAATKQSGSTPSPVSGGAGGGSSSGSGSGHSGTTSSMNFNETVQDSPSPVDLTLSMPPPAAPASANTSGSNTGPSSNTSSSSNTFGMNIHSGSNTPGATDGMDVNMDFGSSLEDFNFGGMHQQHRHQMQSQYEQGGMTPPLMPVTPASIMNLGVGRGGVGIGMSSGTFGGFTPGASSSGGAGNIDASTSAQATPRVTSNVNNSTASASTSVALTTGSSTPAAATGRKAKTKAQGNAEGSPSGAVTNAGAAATRKSTRGKGATAVAASPSLKAILPASDSPVITPTTSSSPAVGATAFAMNAAPAVRKTSHKAAEQKRRDSLKTTFDDLRGLLPPIPLPSDDKFNADDTVVGGGFVAGVVAAARASMLPGALPPRGPPKAGGEGPNKGVSKLQLLICGNEYIRVLKGRVERRDEEIERLRKEVRKLRLRMDISELGKSNTRQLYGMDMMEMSGDQEEEEPVDLEKDLDAVEWVNVRLANSAATTAIPEEEEGESSLPEMDTMDCSTSAETVRSIHCTTIMSQDDTSPLQPSSTSSTTTTPPLSSHSQPSSPRSSHGLPSPPDSPYSDSVSSFPSVSSSFFFSSAAVSPPAHSHDEGDHSSSGASGRAGQGPGLIIPSLTLPDAVKRPTAFGKTLGELRMIIVDGGGGGGSGGGCRRERAAASSLKTSRLARMLLEDNEDVVETAEQWEDIDESALRVLRTSTDWVEHRDAHGLEKFEPARNIQIYEVDDSVYEDEPFHNLSSVLGEKALVSSPDAVPMLASLISAPSSPLYTVLVILIQSSPTSLEEQLVDTLSSQIPVICIPSSSFSLTSVPSRAHSPSSYISTGANKNSLSSFRPLTPLALRHGLFRSPDTLATIRSEASEKFLRWSRVEGVARKIWNGRTTEKARLRDRNLTVTQSTAISKAMTWSKAEWEKEWQGRWEEQLSSDVSVRLQEMEREAGDADLMEFEETSPSDSNDHEEHDDLPLPLCNTETGDNGRTEHKYGNKSRQDTDEGLSQTIHPPSSLESSQFTVPPGSPTSSSVLPGSEESEPEITRTAERGVGSPQPVSATIRPERGPQTPTSAADRKHGSSIQSVIAQPFMSPGSPKRALPADGTPSKSLLLSPNSKHQHRRKTKSRTTKPSPPRLHHSRRGSSPLSPNSKASVKPPLPLTFDPLHLPSLLMFSLSLLGPLKAKIGRTIMAVVCRDAGRAKTEESSEKIRRGSLTATVITGVGVGFCVGVGVGIMISSYGVFGNGGVTA
ncbi:hypothetical protein Moror_6216 [Moniliophthora roreri MCA 2997]|uniref:BHLH domain-containing protein n=1 Tax=Moniliophthora roreri (strain MCA 2997) TaxID=1381753 RepID=V2WS90_MONRO|nr:hypothetical protein Moror_6216 [Moniliophthora roreri MCA 2997]